MSQRRLVALVAILVGALASVATSRVDDYPEDSASPEVDAEVVLEEVDRLR